MADLTAFRASRNLSTKWNRDEVLEAFLQTGLELLHQANTAREEDYQLAKLKLEDWRKALYSKVPNSYRVLGAPLHYNTMDPKSISDLVIRQVEFLESRDRSAAFAMAATMYNLPGELCSTYIYLLLCQKVTERERRRILAAKEQEGRELGQRRARAKRMNYNKKRQHTGSLKAESSQAPSWNHVCDTASTASLFGSIPSFTPGKKSFDDQQEEEGAKADQPASDGKELPPEGNDNDGPDKAGVPLAAVETPEETAPLKKKKKKKKEAKIPKVKKRAPNLSPESEVAYFAIGRNYYGEDEVPDFKALMQDLEDSLAEVLHVSPIRIRGFQARYFEKRLVFAIQPEPTAEGISDAALKEGHKGGESDEAHGDRSPQKAGALSPTFLMEALKQLVDKMLIENDVFSEITGGEATLVWEGPGSRPYCKDEKEGETAEEEHHEDGVSAAVGMLSEEETTKKKKKKKKKKKRITDAEEDGPSSEKAEETPPSPAAETQAEALGGTAAAAGAATAPVAGAVTAAGEVAKKKKKQEREKKKKSKEKEVPSEPERPATPPTKETVPSSPPVKEQPTSPPPLSSSSSSSNSSDEAPPPLPLKTKGLRVAGAGAIARAVYRLRSRKAAASSSGISSSSETDSQTQAAERQMRQRLEDLAKLRQQILQHQQEADSETDSLSLDLSPDVQGLSNNAEVRYLSDEESEGDSDWEEEEAVARELKEKIERLSRRKEELETLKATLANTNNQLIYTQPAIHAAEPNGESKSASFVCSDAATSPQVPAPPPLWREFSVSRSPQPPATTGAVAASGTSASSREHPCTLEHLCSPLLPLQQFQLKPFIPWWSARKEVKRRRLSHFNLEEVVDSSEGPAAEGAAPDALVPQDAHAGAQEPPSDHQSAQGSIPGVCKDAAFPQIPECWGFECPSSSPAEAAAVLLRQQQLLRRRLKELEWQKLDKPRQEQQEPQLSNAARGYRSRPHDFAYHRVQRPRRAEDAEEATDLLSGFLVDTSDSGESEY